jgi:hypothetical protein
METESLVVQDSLAETLWRLEEVRRGFRIKSEVYVGEALDWVLSRQGLRGSYVGELFAPTEMELSGGVQLLTGERIVSGSVRHILGEEALRTAIVWNLDSHPAVARAVKGFHRLLDRGGAPSARESGFYCCYTCTPAFLRTLTVVKPDNWDSDL